MRKLGVLLVLSAVLLVLGVVSTASANSDPGAVVMVCRGFGQSSAVWTVSPLDPFAEGIVRDTDCATAIQLLLGDRCTLKDVLAPAIPTPTNTDELAFIFICSSSAIDPNP